MLFHKVLYFLFTKPIALTMFLKLFVWIRGKRYRGKPTYAFRRRISR